MRIREIERLNEFEALRSHWETVRAVDPHATIFSSWGWLRGWIDTGEVDWRVLAAIPEEGALPVAFLPLQITSRRGRFRIRPEVRLSLLGFPMADQTGFVCTPKLASEVLPAFADAAQRLMESDPSRSDT